MRGRTDKIKQSDLIYAEDDRSLAQISHVWPANRPLGPMCKSFGHKSHVARESLALTPAGCEASREFRAGGLLICRDFRHRKVGVVRQRQ